MPSCSRDGPCHPAVDLCKPKAPDACSHLAESNSLTDRRQYVASDSIDEASPMRRLRKPHCQCCNYEHGWRSPTMRRDGIKNKTQTLKNTDLIIIGNRFLQTRTHTALDTNAATQIRHCI